MKPLTSLAGFFKNAAASIKIRRIFNDQADRALAHQILATSERKTSTACNGLFVLDNNDYGSAFVGCGVGVAFGGLKNPDCQGIVGALIENGLLKERPLGSNTAITAETIQYVQAVNKSNPELKRYPVKQLVRPSFLEHLIS
jgi:hypothetical protein